VDVKQAVKKRYGEMARQAGKSCCGGARTAETAAEAIGYTSKEMAAVPEGANLGLGCGNPLALAAVRAGDVVLDLGSGAGFDAFLGASRVGAEGRVIGVDMTEDMVSQARANAARGGYTNVEFRLGEIESLPVEDSSIDLVISNCVLNLVPDKAQAFREIARVLKPGGRMMVSDIVRRGELPAWVLEDAEAYVACVAGAAEQEEYLGLIRAAGLTDVEVLAAADAADLLASATDCACSVPDDALGQFRGKVFSISVRARRPDLGSRASA
jgi:arsenite methyltransferase